MEFDYLHIGLLALCGLLAGGFFFRQNQKAAKFKETLISVAATLEGQLGFKIIPSFLRSIATNNVSRSYDDAQELKEIFGNRDKLLSEIDKAGMHWLAESYKDAGERDAIRKKIAALDAQYPEVKEPGK